ncbi:MAG: arsenite methyltransferase [Deltaproteobacteria bacterium]|nr:arsenite methyltransferase [Deltaproteobacteria bacterium]
MSEKLNVLFLCTGNSCRSQMAEGWTRHLRGDLIEAYSAGIETHGLNPNAVKVMAEVGVDISGHKSQHINEFKGVKLDAIVTVCGHAHETCPFFPSNCKVIHIGFDDPPKMAKELAQRGASEEAQLDCYRTIRDAIKAFVETLPEALGVVKEGDTQSENKDRIREQVRTRYAEIAQENGSCCGSGCCGATPSVSPDFSTRLGYTAAELSAVPGGANMGLGCGNPQAIAQMKPAEVVLDLGCGGGLDCFLAAKQVGAAGRVIGVDMTPEMIAKARENARKGDYTNVEFRLGEIEHLPVANDSVDVIISNCVINLSPAKEQVFREAYRVLRQNGRLAVSDVVAIAPLPDEVRQSMDAHCGCVAGAALVQEIEQMLHDAGFSEVSIGIKEESEQFIRDWFPKNGRENYVRSAVITAVK